jgi:ribosomal protein S18 acetylase RimI-like enzyme
MGSQVVVRRATATDAPELARVQVETWRETYRGIMRDEVLDDPGSVAKRERFWTTVLTDEHVRDRTAAVAELEGKVVGLALAGPPLDDDATWTRQLYVLYTLAAVHGSGAGAALLEAVLDDDASVALWVADPNPRAQSFYRKHGFEPDGTSQVDHGVHEIRMVRPSSGTPVGGPST